MTQYNETVNSWKKSRGKIISGLVGLIIGVGVVNSCVDSITNSGNPFANVYDFLTNKEKSSEYANQEHERGY